MAFQFFALIKQNRKSFLKKIQTSIYVISICIYYGVTPALADGNKDERPFSIDDYFNYKRVVELSISPNGEMMAYSVATRSLKENKSARTVYISATVPGSEPLVVEGVRKASSLAWINDQRKLAFLHARDGVTQVYSYDLQSATIREHTQSKDGVTKFGFAPDGRSLAYITRGVASNPTLFERFQNGEEGIVVDPEILSVQHFIDPNRRRDGSEPTQDLWLLLDGGLPIRIKLLGDAVDFYWASNSSKLSVTFNTSKPSTSVFAPLRKGIGIYDVDHGQFRILATPAKSRLYRSEMAYASDRWIPGENKLIVRRSALDDLWIDVTHADWTIVDVSIENPLLNEKNIWRAVSLNLSDPGYLFHPRPDGRVLINKTERGAYRSVYEVPDTRVADILRRSEVAKDISGNISKLRFGASFDRAIFVNDSLTRPPEIYLWQQRHGSVRLTSLNREVFERSMPVAREVKWKSKDGTIVQGWLLLPEVPAQGQMSWPLITFVHGGPAQPMPVDFAGHFRSWPYPFETYALNGIAVFFANYRGNSTFGRPFADPEQLDREPVDDIISGIEHVLGLGWFDRDLLGISGFSHGAWLGPMVMTRSNIFQAGSFADGWGNTITVYDTVPGRINQEIQDKVYGVSLYADPERYLDLAPSLHFEDVEAAVLFEAGAQSLPISMMGYPKAARYASMPTEFVVYPKTRHTPNLPSIQKESAERNLDWFRFWLLGEEDLDPAKSEQYKRWRGMKAERCAKIDETPPSYCDFK